MKKYLLFIIIVMLLNIGWQSFVFAQPQCDATSVILMESSTGKVLYEKNADQKLPPASVTKIMTMLIVMEAIDSGRISYEDMVSVSEKAASMGGSQVYLESGEKMSVDEMLKCVAVASANDAALALAEHVAGSEEKFVEMMNYRAGELGMYNTHFENTNGLDDTTSSHLTSARDIGIMSLELLKHEKILEYTSIWMDTVRNGQFGLSNTNKLIRYYRGANGLKTGSTSKAKYCISATAKRDGLQLIAVVMASPTKEARNDTAVNLLDYGFSNYKSIEYKGKDLGEIKVMGGDKESVKIKSSDYKMILKKNESNDINIIMEIPNKVSAPIEKGSVIGNIVYKDSNDDELGRCEIIATERVENRSFIYQFKKILSSFLLY